MNRYLVILLMMFGLGGCAVGTPGSNTAPLVQIPDMQTGAFSTRPALTEFNGELAVLYSTKDDRVALQIGNQPMQLIDATARVKKGGGFFQLWPQGNSLYAAWWSHQEGKNVYITSSMDGGKSFAPVSMVNDLHDVLPPFTLTRSPQGILGMTYQDERSPRYQAYFNRSTDNGLSWPRPDVRLDAPPAEGRSSDVHEPQTVEAGSSWVSAWTDNVQSAGKTSYRIVSRRTDDAGVTWDQPAVLFSSDHHISALIVKSVGNGLVLAADVLNQGVISLVSQDEGRTWQGTGVLSGTSGLSNSGIAMVISNGRAHLVWMEQRKEEKIRIVTATLDVLKHEWVGGVKRLDPKSHENTKSLSPVISVTEQGALVSAWVDYRDIRPNIYLATSYDQGTSWSAPQPLLNPGAVSAGWPQLVQIKDRTAIAYELYPTERVAEGSFHARVLPVDQGVAAMANMSTFPKISEVERTARLTQRVNALWAYRIAGNYDAAYDMFDFAYRAATPKKIYTANAGVITYLTYNVDEISITGNEANVKSKIKYEVKPTILPTTGKPISVPPVEVESPNRWVWVGDEWYLVYTPTFDPPMLNY
jgi:hypothetical protein